MIGNWYFLFAWYAKLLAALLKLPFNSPNHTEINKKEEANLLNFLFFVSGYQDSNLGPPAPKAGALTRLRYTPFCNFFYFWLRCKGRYFFLTTKYFIVFFIYVHSHQFRRSLQHVYPLYQLLEWTYCKPICYISNDKTKFK